VIVNWFPSAHIQRQLDAIGRVSQSRRGNLPGARSEFVKVCYNSLRASSSPVTKKIGRPTSKRPSRAPPANPVIAYGRLATGAVERCITSENWRSNSVVRESCRITGWIFSGAESPFLRWRLHGLDDFIRKQVLNIVRENDADQLPAPLQKLEREMEALPQR
jgi:hypothetical protein